MDPVALPTVFVAATAYRPSKSVNTLVAFGGSLPVPVAECCNYSPLAGSWIAGVKQEGDGREAPLVKRTNRKKSRTGRPSLPELDQTKRSVLNGLTSLQSRRSYQHAMDEFIEWYSSEPQLALNRAVVLRYRLQLEAKKLAASTINVRLAAVRRLAYEAADSGLLSPELVAGKRHVQGVPELGRRVGN